MFDVVLQLRDFLFSIPCKNSPAVKKGKTKNAQDTDFGIIYDHNKKM